jgi:hypothetical protein
MDKEMELALYGESHKPRKDGKQATMFSFGGWKKILTKFCFPAMTIGRMNNDGT